MRVGFPAVAGNSHSRWINFWGARQLLIGIVSVVIAVILLWSLATRETFREMNYDTLEKRRVVKTTIVGIKIADSIERTSGGFREQYREIYGADPPENRWHSASAGPIRISQRFTEGHLAREAPLGVLVRHDMAALIFAKYERDHSVAHAREALSALESLLPSNKQLEELDQDELRPFFRKAEKIPALKELIDLRIFQWDNSPSD